MDNVFTLLNSEDKEEIKKAVKALIIQRVAKDIKEHNRWLLDYDDVRQIVDEAIGLCIREIRDEMKDNIKEKIMEKFNQL